MGRQTISTVLWETEVKTTSKPLTGIVQLIAFAVCLALAQFEALFHVLSEVVAWLYVFVLRTHSVWIRCRCSTVPCTRELVRLPVIFASDPCHRETSSGTDVFLEKEKQNFSVAILNSSLM